MTTYLQETAKNRKKFFKQNQARLKQLVIEGQKPHALFISCSDSRIMPEQLMGAKPGDLFMLRNIANTIPPYTQTEIGVVSVLEYAILSLRVPHVIVCGHTDCGGVRAVDKPIDMMRQPALSRWADIIRPAQRDVDFAMRDLSPEERHHAIVKRHVILQLINLQSYPFIRQAMETVGLQLHGWIYDLFAQQLLVYDPNTETFHPENS